MEAATEYFCGYMGVGTVSVEDLTTRLRQELSIPTRPYMALGGAMIPLPALIDGVVQKIQRHATDGTLELSDLNLREFCSDNDPVTLLTIGTVIALVRADTVLQQFAGEISAAQCDPKTLRDELIRHGGDLYFHGKHAPAVETV